MYAIPSVNYISVELGREKPPERHLRCEVPVRLEALQMADERLPRGCGGARTELQGYKENLGVI